MIADLTGAKPNCYYEAGYAHGLQKEVIFTIRRPEKPHFDLAGRRFIMWETEDDLRVQLLQHVRDIRRRLQVTFGGPPGLPKEPGPWDAGNPDEGEPLAATAAMANLDG